MNTFKLEIITPDRRFFGGDAESAVVTTTHGEMGVLPNAMPLVANLSDGLTKIKQAGKWMDAITGEGFIEINPSGAVVLVQSAEWPYEIKTKTVLDEIDALNERLKKQQSLREYKMAKAQLARQLVRLRLKKNMLD